MKELIDEYVSAFVEMTVVLAFIKVMANIAKIIFNIQFSLRF